MTNLGFGRDACASADVFVSDLLRGRHPLLHAELTTQLARFGIALREIPGTRDIWCRDYMPVPIGDGRFVQFRYAPDYLADAPELITPTDVAEQVVGTCRRSELVVDGGNVVRRGRVAVVTEKIFAENPRLSRSQVMQQLSTDLEIDRLVVIPIEPGDVCGHADGVLHLMDGRTALVNNYTDVDPDYGTRLRRVLREHGIESLPMPYVPDLSQVGDVPSATGVYVNLLETAEVIFVPTYGIEADKPAPTRRAVLDPTYIDAFDAEEQVFPKYPDFAITRAAYQEILTRIQSLVGGDRCA